MGDVPGTRRRPWKLKAADDGAPFQAWRDPAGSPPAIVVRSGATEIRFHLRCLNDLHEMLKERGDWMPLGAAGERATASSDSVEAWARSSGNPVRGWYGLTPGLRGRFGAFVPPIMQALELVEVDPEGRRVRAI
jgi:hypothetical protein